MTYKKCQGQKKSMQNFSRRRLLPIEKFPFCLCFNDSENSSFWQGVVGQRLPQSTLISMFKDFEATSRSAKCQFQFLKKLTFNLIFLMHQFFYELCNNDVHGQWQILTGVFDSYNRFFFSSFPVKFQLVNFQKPKRRS